MKHFLLITMLFFTWTAHAKEIFPDGCTPHAIHGDSVILATEKPTIFTLHNLTDTKIWLTRQLSHPGAGAQAGWSSLIDPGQWSALALSPQKNKFTLTCIESRPGHEQSIPCADVLAICQWPHAQLPENKSGTFWAGENMGMRTLKAYLERMGFQLN